MDAEELTTIFGSASVGSTPNERAASSTVMFVRSQIVLARYTPEAKGRRLTAAEALRDHGVDALAEVAIEGQSTIVSDEEEPASTLRERRQALGLEVDEVARAARLTPETVEKAETVGARSSVRDIETIARTLGLDETAIGRVTGANGDHDLGVRLRQMRTDEFAGFSANVVLDLSEAAWVTSRQVALSTLLGERFPKRAAFHPSDDYRYKAADKGRALAEKARQILGLSTTEAIGSLKTLTQGVLGIPVVQMKLSPRFAGATLANGDARGIVVNEEGHNRNVFVRRMTVAHELGHLLWDPDRRLNRLSVVTYDEIERRKVNADEVEMRANAFAVNLLAPPEGVIKAMKASTLFDGLSAVMSTYGISLSAARWHVMNCTGEDVANVGRPLTEDDEWKAAENSTLDLFEPRSVPLSRRGRFAWLVARAQAERLISLDTAASFLRTSISDLEPHLAFIRDCGE